MNVVPYVFFAVVLSSQSGNIWASEREDREHGNMSDNVQAVNKVLYLE